MVPMCELETGKYDVRSATTYFGKTQPPLPISLKESFPTPPITLEIIMSKVKIRGKLYSQDRDMKGNNTERVHLGAKGKNLLSIP